MSKPETWIDILGKNKNTPETKASSHRWIVTGSYSNRSVGVRSISGLSNENSSFEGSYISYKCSKCGIKGKKYVGSAHVECEENLTCDEYTIKDILE